MNVEQLLSQLQKIHDKTLPVAFSCTENNVFGYLPVERIEILPAAFGQQVILESS